MQTLHSNTPVRSTFSWPEKEMPSHARVVIVGGGIAGCSVAYHLARQGWTDVVLLEQGRLSSGTTWHSAGQVGQLRASQSQTILNRASARLYANLESETGHHPGWLQCGGLQLACSSERMTQLKRQAVLADVFGVEAHLLSPDEIEKRWPVIRTDDLQGGVWLPGDGRVLPGECTIALAKGAMQHGAACYEGVGITGLNTTETGRATQRITGVETTRGSIKADWVVLCAGMWMRQLGLSINVDIPVYPCEHHYVVTHPVPGITRDFPCGRDPDAGLYFRSLDDGGMKLGSFPRSARPWNIQGEIPADFAFRLLPEDWDVFAPALAAHHHRIPPTRDVEIARLVNGPESFTPDNQFIMGLPPQTEGLFVLGGFNSAGIACAGGAGQFAAEWMEHGEMTMDLGSVDIRRFGPFHNQRPFLEKRVTEVLGLHYRMAWPNREFETARDIRQTPLHGALKERAAVFGQNMAWERANWFGPPTKLGYTFGRPDWLDQVTREVHACRQNVALFDQSTFSKFKLHGPGALEALQYLCGNQIDVPVGRSVYTGLFNDRGTFESDLTLIRTGQEAFYIITATGQTTHDFDWIYRHLPVTPDLIFEDVTEQFAVISIMGPKARTLLQPLTQTDLSHEAFSFGDSQLVEIGGVEVRALRITYVGELGWELHVAADLAPELYRTLAEAGQTLDLKPAGYYAIGIMRIEKAYRAWGKDLSVDETPLEAGLSFALDWNKPFKGRDALLQQKKSGLRKRLASFILEDCEPVLWGGEPIVRNGEVVGYTTSAAWSPTLNASVAMGYLKSSDPIRSAFLREGAYTINSAGQQYVTRISHRAPYDPARTKILC